MRRLLAAIASLALLIPLVSALSPTQPSEAAPLAKTVANAGLFNPGNIISDANFYDGSAMTSSGIADFLQQRVPNCAAGYTCLKDYRQNTPTMAPSVLCPGGYAGAANERSNDIIAKVGQACNISQRVLIVLLQKEQGLVTATSPSAGKFNAATGFSCPDTAPCDPAFSGFFYQVYYAARQFQNYAQNPTRWNYQAGRVNSILYNPNAGCGRGNVYIQNKATAGLYIYTPYQPNAAAMANLYGTGDGCSSYGNRNFWRIFTDWFGNPTGASSLMRTNEDSTVYLVSGTTKYPIGSMAVLASLAVLGPVGFVSQTYLNSLTTSHLVGKSIRSPDGTIWFIDSGVKLAYPSCEVAADYGSSCTPDGYVQLDDVQSAAFQPGPVLTSVLGTTQGSRYYIKNSTKSEILDDASQIAAGIPLAMNVLTENAVAHLPLVAPIVRDGVIVLQRGTSNYVLLSGGKRYAVASAADAASLGVSTRVAGTLSQASLEKLPGTGVYFSGVISSTEGPGTWILIGGKRYEVTAGGLDPASAIPLAQALVDSYPLGGTLGAGSFFKTPSNATVYIIMPNDIRPISSWNALLALTVDGNPVIYTIADSIATRMKKGPVALIAGTLVRSPQNATVYFIDGVTGRIALSNFIFPAEAGFATLIFAHQDNINGYPETAREMTFGFTCGSDRYVAAGGQLHLVPPALWSLYPMGDFPPYDSFTCRSFKYGAQAGSFIRTPDGSIYQLVGGTKRPVSSTARFYELAQGATWMNVAYQFAAVIPTGPVV